MPGAWKSSQTHHEEKQIQGGTVPGTACIVLTNCTHPYWSPPIGGAEAYKGGGGTISISRCSYPRWKMRPAWESHGTKERNRFIWPRRVLKSPAASTISAHQLWDSDQKTSFTAILARHITAPSPEPQPRPFGACDPDRPRHHAISSSTTRETKKTGTLVADHRQSTQPQTIQTYESIKLSIFLINYYNI